MDIVEKWKYLNLQPADCMVSVNTKEIHEAVGEIVRLRAQMAEARSFLREHWASREFLMSNPPKHMVCYRAWEILNPRTSPATPPSE